MKHPDLIQTLTIDRPNRKMNNGEKIIDDLRGAAKNQIFDRFLYKSCLWRKVSYAN